MVMENQFYNGYGVYLIEIVLYTSDQVAILKYGCVNIGTF